MKPKGIFIILQGNCMIQHLQQLAIIQPAKIFTATELQPSPYQMSSVMTIKLKYFV
jgi:hypothetical protein